MRFNSVLDVVGSAFSNMSTGFVAQDDFHFVKVILFPYTVFQQIEVSLCRHIFLIPVTQNVTDDSLHHRQSVFIKKLKQCETLFSKSLI